MAKVTHEDSKIKICICGKGGTGKSTVVVLLADALKRTGKDVIVLDSDKSGVRGTSYIFV